jgi:hypothetical protein
MCLRLKDTFVPCGTKAGFGGEDVCLGHGDAWRRMDGLEVWRWEGQELFFAGEKRYGQEMLCGQEAVSEPRFRSALECNFTNMRQPWF